MRSSDGISKISLNDKKYLCTFSIQITAIPAFGFEGHFTAAVSRGWRPVDRTAGPALRLIDLTPVRVYSRATHDDFFFCFLRSNDRTKTGVCFLSFLLRSLRLTKTVLKPKKGHASALPASVAGSSYLSSSKDRWTTNGIDRMVSVEQTERASSGKA